MDSRHVRLRAELAAANHRPVRRGRLWKVCGCCGQSWPCAARTAGPARPPFPRVAAVALLVGGGVVAALGFVLPVWASFLALILLPAGVIGVTALTRRRP